METEPALWTTQEVQQALQHMGQTILTPIEQVHLLTFCEGMDGNDILYQAQNQHLSHAAEQGLLAVNRQALEEIEYNIVHLELSDVEIVMYDSDPNESDSENPNSP